MLFPYLTVPVPGCICASCNAARSEQSTHAAANDKALADAVRKAHGQLSDAVDAARKAGLTLDFTVIPEGQWLPVKATPYSFVLQSIYREKTETKTTRVDL